MVRTVLDKRLWVARDRGRGKRRNPLKNARLLYLLGHPRTAHGPADRTCLCVMLSINKTLNTVAMQRPFTLGRRISHGLMRSSPWVLVDSAELLVIMRYVASKVEGGKKTALFPTCLTYRIPPCHQSVHCTFFPSLTIIGGGWGALSLFFSGFENVTQSPTKPSQARTSLNYLIHASRNPTCVSKIKNPLLIRNPSLPFRCTAPFLLDDRGCEVLFRFFFTFLSAKILATPRRLST
jgi:hypothetical protein